MRDEIKGKYEDKVFVVKNFETDKVPLGEFSVIVDGDTLFSKRDSGRWPKAGEIMKKLDKKLSEGNEEKIHREHENKTKKPKEEGVAHHS